MKLAIIHMSDIHFKASRTPLQSRAKQLAAAATAVESAVQHFVIALSGDIANTGDKEEFVNASSFLSELTLELKARGSSPIIDIVAVPGNHDCILPEDQTAVRNALIAGIENTLTTPKPDPGLISQLLSVQQPFWTWLGETTPPAISTDREKLCHVRSIRLPDGMTLNVLLVNTALTSRRQEQQADLDLPIEIILSTVPPLEHNTLNISVFHHSYEWMPANTALRFRGIIDQFSDLVLTGHQHSPHGYNKSVDTGEELTYLEAPALQDAAYPNNSSFRAIFVDLKAHKKRIVLFKWKDDSFRTQIDSDWKELWLNRHNRPRFVAKSDFLAILNNPGFAYEIPSGGGLLRLEDIFVAPDIKVIRESDESETIASDGTVKYLLEIGHAICGGPIRCGKSSLAAILFLASQAMASLVPLLLDGKRLTHCDLPSLRAEIEKRLGDQYESVDPELYWQLEKHKLLIIVDDWHLTRLDKSERDQVMRFLGEMAEHVILFCDDIFRLQDNAEAIRETKAKPSFKEIILKEFGHVSRGKLVDRWLSIEHRGEVIDSNEKQREIEETDRLLLSVMGRRTLPSLPFIILCILQARQRTGATPPEAGSFGYLYEVLVTTTLNRSISKKPQLDKKYTILSLLAFELFKNDGESLSRGNFLALIERYSRTYKVKVREDHLVTDLLEAKVLTEREGNLFFTYNTFYFYFVARYFKDYIEKHKEDTTLGSKIDYMVDHLGKPEYSTIIMFLVYFTKDTRIISRLMSRADAILSEREVCKLESDTSFLGKMITEGREITMPDSSDLQRNRLERRQAADRAEKVTASNSIIPTIHAYSDELRPVEKLRLGFQHLEVLGQIVRNFPGSLPGDQKVLIIDAAYRLGMRCLTSIMDFIKDNLVSSRAKLIKEQESVLPSEKEAIKERSNQFDEMLRELGELASYVFVRQVSSSIGLADLEDAYTDAFEMSGNSSATRLVDLSIKLDHVNGFPEDVVRHLKKETEDNAAAFRTLQLLFAEHVYVFGMDYRLKQRIAGLLSIKMDHVHGGAVR